MFSKFLSATAVALAAMQVSAQTYTACDPREKSCPADPAFGKENVIDIDFTKESKYFVHAEGTNVKYGPNGAEFSMSNEKQAPTVTSSKYIFFGRVEVVLKAAPGVGVVTSVVLQSDDRDEIDWEWLGGDTAQVQTNYFGKGDDSTFDRGGYSDVANPQSTWHTYTIDWTKEYVRWIIDGQQVRELLYSEAKDGTRFPQTPAQIKLGIWDAGSSTAPEGTVEWAGGRTDFSKGPFTAYYKSIKIQDYSNGVSNAKEYVWEDGSDGSYQSIKVVKGDGSGDDDDTTTTTSSSSTPKPTHSKTSSSESESVTKTSETTKTVTKTHLTTLSTATSSGAATTDDAPGKGATKTTDAPTTATESGSPSETTTDTSDAPSPTNAGFRTSFSGALIGAGLLAAAAL